MECPSCKGKHLKKRIMMEEGEEFEVYSCNDCSWWGTKVE